MLVVAGLRMTIQLEAFSIAIAAVFLCVVAVEFEITSHSSKNIIGICPK